MDSKHRYQQHRRHRHADERYERSQNHRQATDQLDRYRGPGHEMRLGNADRRQDPGEYLGSARQLGIAMLHETVPHDQSKGDGRPAGQRGVQSRWDHGVLAPGRWLQDGGFTALLPQGWPQGGLVPRARSAGCLHGWAPQGSAPRAGSAGYLHGWAPQGLAPRAGSAGYLHGWAPQGLAPRAGSPALGRYDSQVTG